MTPTRAIAYVRVSTDEQAKDGHSLDTQRAAITRYAEANGIEIVEHIADPGVGSTTPFSDRPGGAKALRMLARKGADMLLTTADDRLFRDTTEGLQFFDWAATRGVAVHSLREQIDSRTAAGRLALTLTLAAARYERDVIGERTKQALTRLRESGFAFGQVPTGCRKVNGKLYRDPAAWAVREQIVHRYRTGTDPETGGRWSYARLAFALRAERIDPPATRHSTREGRMWSTAVLRSMVTTHESLQHLPMANDATAAHA